MDEQDGAYAAFGGDGAAGQDGEAGGGGEGSDGDEADVGCTGVGVRTKTGESQAFGAG